MLFVVPGLVIFTLTSLAAPLMMVEDLGILDAIRRSVTVVLAHFWLVLAIVTVPILAEHQLLHLVEGLMHLRVLLVLVLHLALLSLVVAPVLVSEVVLAHQLTDDPLHEHQDHEHHH